LISSDPSHIPNGTCPAEVKKIVRSERDLVRFEAQTQSGEVVCCKPNDTICGKQLSFERERERERERGGL